jgi:hypothetical protein
MDGGSVQSSAARHLGAPPHRSKLIIASHTVCSLNAPPRKWRARLPPATHIGAPSPSCRIRCPTSIQRATESSIGKMVSISRSRLAFFVLALLVAGALPLGARGVGRGPRLARQRGRARPGMRVLQQLRDHHRGLVPSVPAARALLQPSIGVGTWQGVRWWRGSCAARPACRESPRCAEVGWCCAALSLLLLSRRPGLQAPLRRSPGAPRPRPSRLPRAPCPGHPRLPPLSRSRSPARSRPPHPSPSPSPRRRPRRAQPAQRPGPPPQQPAQRPGPPPQQPALRPGLLSLL